VTRENERVPSSDAPVSEEAQQAEVHGAPPGGTGRLRRAGLRLGRMKWVYLGVLGVISLGFALKLAYPLLSIHLDPFGRFHKRDMGVNPEDYEPMSPFFIPMPSGRDKVAARVDIRVKWDRLTGARFKRDAVLIRQRIYLYLRELDQWSEDLEANRRVLEAGIGRILRQTLGVKDVDVLVENIHYVQIEALSLGTSADSRENDYQTSSVKGVCSWMNSPMSATPYWGSIPPTRWWG
jgi:hypothetical protein